MPQALNAIVQHIDIGDEELGPVNGRRINLEATALGRVNDVVSNHFPERVVHPVVLDRLPVHAGTISHREELVPEANGKQRNPLFNFPNGLEDRRLEPVRVPRPG